ncbi:hypothetical protein CHLNCDRAFT_48549 [Chlorella variabilis]|uniref:Serine incorporator n=1 Tax=Chlorella variabilis TaxID=554065 RepID=E1Z607_CHLVA|nr:hypothetical protein CHLNCDRAFT_48549 [Chlorella variabilis]EFN58848.1 hypothetical protein CHLNCDRAFT_48549 [Chlorella variabilis]|eukprot:XP_005850950.1 hypothetical protein CHLNCDRAFT_48549 [Chlorella variabilis]
MFALGSCLTSAAAGCACSCCTAVTQQALRSSARAAWSILFTFSLVGAWIARDFGSALLKKLPWILRHFGGGEMPSDAWFGQQAVYRISLGNFVSGVLFGALAVVMAGVQHKSDRRDRSLHHGHWLLKAGLWALCNALPFFLPVGVVGAYSWLARFGSPLFLLIQMIILLDVTQSWNDAWVEAGEGDVRYFHALLAVTAAAYAGCAAIAGLLYHFFAPASADCSLNISLITLALILCIVLSTITLHPAVQRGSLFPAACISLYTMYLQYSALQSEPRDYECNALGARLSAASATTLATGVLLTLVSVVYSAFRAGSNTQTFRWARAAGYLINVGWTSVWVKVVSQWVTVGLYCWTLVAPQLFPDRDFA